MNNQVFLRSPARTVWATIRTWTPTRARAANPSPAAESLDARSPTIGIHAIHDNKDLFSRFHRIDEQSIKDSTRRKIRWQRNCMTSTNNTEETSTKPFGSALVLTCVAACGQIWTISEKL